MIAKELLIGATEAWLAVVSAVGILLAVLLYTRVIGLRTFSKMSAFDFAVTVAIGSAIGSVSLLGSSLSAGILAIGTLLVVQYLIAQLRTRWTFSAAVDNAPVVLMAGRKFLHDNLRRSRVTEDDVRAKLREANAYNYDMVQAVILGEPRRHQRHPRRASARSGHLPGCLRPPSARRPDSRINHVVCRPITPRHGRPGRRAL